MKRLSVRLSIVAAVLALGSSAIAYKVLSKPGDAPSQNGEQEIAAEKTSPPATTSPIRTEGEQPPESSRTLQPPPRSVFEPGNSLRTVSHESVPPGEEQDDTENTANSAEMIPTADPADANSTYNTSFPLAARSYGSDAPSPAGSTGAGDTPRNPASALPAAPTYGAGYTTSDASGSSTAGLPDDRPANGTGGIAPPTPSYSATAPATDSPARSPGTGSSLGMPVAAGDDAENSPAGPLGTQPMADGSSVSSTGLRSGTSPATGLAAGPTTGANAAGLTNSPLGAAAGSAMSATGSPLATAAAPTSSYPSTDPANSSPSGTNTQAQPVANTYGTSPANTAASAAGGYAPATSASVYPSTDSAAAANSTYSATAGGNANAAVRDGSTPVLVSDMPGDRQLEGQQTPAILLEKLAPEEIQVDRKATFQVRVRNAGNATAHHVVVVDRVPRGTEFIDAVPPVTPTADGTLVWQLETVKPGEEVTLSMNLMPKVAGEIGSVAQATFQAQASVRAICTKPELKLDVTIPAEILIGQPAALEITVTNTGNGAAEEVVIEEDVPEGFTHAAGRQLETKLGTLRPQESRRLTLVLDSTKPGSYENHLSVRGEGNLFDEDVRKIDVTSPQLQLAMQGPTLRYLDRQATYAVHLANPGTAPARNVELVTYLPKGMKYVTSDNQGQYDTQSHAVYWSLEELPADKQGDVHFTVLPIEPGNHKLKTDGRADLGLTGGCEHEVAVEGLAELAFTVSDVADPIEVGSDTAYEIRVQNKGSKPDTDIQLVADLPEGMTPTTGDGPTQGTVQGQRVVFAPLARLGPNEEAVYKIHAHGDLTGDHVVRVQLRSAEVRAPVTKEEITRVYSDK